MPKSLRSWCVLAAVLFSLPLLRAQDRKGAVTGRVTDSAKAVLQGARVETDPKGPTAVSDGQGQFSISGLAPGKYKLIVSYVGFTNYARDVEISPGATANVDVVMQVASTVESITVRGDRQAGEVEALNRERTADNILQVLPAEVITSLPNTNIADAIGRLPSVSLERDEGEGKYIQIRGTEPRLSNVTVNGIHLPSPEPVRNVKLDVIPSDLVDSIEVSKTLSANQDADAIGGSANLVTKSPADQPYVTVLGMGGYTPISGGKYLNQFDATAGQRFGANKKFGLLFGGSYDYNQRGINDVEPAPTVNPLPNGQNFFGPNTEDLRDYVYDRTRYGFGGEADYKLGDMSSVYFRGLFAHFNDFGHDWIYSPVINNFITDTTDPNNTCGITSVSGVQGCGATSFTNVFRQPEQQIFSVQAGARHVFGDTWLTYEVALSQAYYIGGYPRASFNGPGSSDNSVAFGVDTTDPFTPKLPVLNGVNIYDPSSYNLAEIDPSYTNTFERDVVGAISAAKNYSIGSHFSTIEVGFKGWDARKSQVDFEQSFFATPTDILMSSFLSSFRDPNYYFGRYQFGPATEYRKIAAFFNANQGQFTGGYQPQNSIPNDFDVSERIWAGYAMNTITLGRLRLQTGLRIESTRDQLRGNNVVLDTNGNYTGFTPSIGDNTYTNFFPSVQAQYRVGADTVLRASYGIGIARPNFSDLVPFVTYDPTSSIPVSAGNPSLKPTHAQNFDLLAEHYLKPVGILQAGVFYKYLTDPIYVVNSVRPSNVQYPGLEQVTSINGPRAHIVGVETSWQQRLAFLPGPLNGMGVRANYSYTSSRASFPAGSGRTDHPTLLRTAPNNWNLDVTYDKKGFSARMGLTHNDANVWSYGYQDGAIGGPHGPLGDTYLYPHTQVDAQFSYWIPRGHGLQAIVSMLNLNNEVFGFYNGSEQYPIQREYYNRTFSFGARWTLPVEAK